VIDESGFAYGLHQHSVGSAGQRVGGKIKRARTDRHGIQGHQILAVGADIYLVVVDGVFISGDGPLQAVPLQTRRNRKAIIDAGFDFRPLFIIVPGDKLDCIELVARVVVAVRLVESLQPGLSALLAHDAVLAPGSERVVEAFVGRPDGVFRRRRQTAFIELVEIRHPVIGHVHNDPRVAASAHGMGESSRMLEDEVRVGAGGCGDSVPVNRVMEVDVEIGNHRTAVHAHVSRRGHVGLLDVLNLSDQGLLRIAAAAGAE